MVRMSFTSAKPSINALFSFEVKKVILESGKCSRNAYTAGNVKITSPIDFNRMIRISAGATERDGALVVDTNDIVLKVRASHLTVNQKPVTVAFTLTGGRLSGNQRDEVSPSSSNLKTCGDLPEMV